MYPYSETSGRELDWSDLDRESAVFEPPKLLNMAPSWVPSIPPYHKRNWLTFRTWAQEVAAELKVHAKIMADPFCGHWPFRLNPDEAPGLSAAAWLQPPKTQRRKGQVARIPLGIKPVRVRPRPPAFDSRPSL